MAQPINTKNQTYRKSCGRALVERLDRICLIRGGYLSHLDRFPHKRVRRGIVHECCLNKCADTHMYAYCSNTKPKSSESEKNTSVEVPVQPRVDTTNVQLPKAEALIRTVDTKNVIEQTNTPQQTVETTTATTTTEKAVEITFQDHRYHDIFVNKDIDSNTLNQLLSSLPYNSNPPEYQTVPPEYQISPMIPSRSRLMFNSGRQ